MENFVTIYSIPFGDNCSEVLRVDATTLGGAVCHLEKTYNLTIVPSGEPKYFIISRRDGEPIERSPQPKPQTWIARLLRRKPCAVGYDPVFQITVDIHVVRELEGTICPKQNLNFLLNWDDHIYILPTHSTNTSRIC